MVQTLLKTFVLLFQLFSVSQYPAVLACWVLCLLLKPYKSSLTVTNGIDFPAFRGDLIYKGSVIAAGSEMNQALQLPTGL